MTRPTKTRQELRRALANELGMPFFQLYADGYSTPDSTSTTDKLIDDTLTQADDYWNNHYVFFPSTTGSNAGDVRLISDFSSASNALIPERSFSGAPDTSDEYEIHSVFTAIDLHQAINRAILDSYPSFYDVATDETLILKEDTLEYDLTALTVRPWMMTRVYVEQSYSGFTGEVEAAGSASIGDASADFTDVAAGWLFSIYANTGAGQLRTVNSVSGSTLTFTEDWTTEPDTTSKYRVWDSSDETVIPHRLLSLHFDTPEWPSKMTLHGLWPRSYGLRLMLQYTCRPGELSADSSTTVVPQEYILNKAMSILSTRKIMDNQYDREMFMSAAQKYEQNAEFYRQRDAFRPPPLTLWHSRDETNFYARSDGDPLGWGG